MFYVLPGVMNISPTFYYLTTDHAFSVRASYYVTMTCYRTLITAECWEAGPGHPGLVSTFVQKATFHWYTIIWYKQHFTRMFFVLCLFIFYTTINCHEVRISFIIINKHKRYFVKLFIEHFNIFIMCCMLRSIWWGCKNRSCWQRSEYQFARPSVGGVGGCRLDNDNVSCRCPAPARQYASRRLCWQSTKQNGLIKEFSKNVLFTSLSQSPKSVP